MNISICMDVQVDDIIPPYHPPILQILRQDTMVAFIEHVKRWFLLDENSVPSETAAFPTTHFLGF